MATLSALAIVSFVVDQNTGDTTGPPYHDSVLNHIAFFAFFTSAVALVALVAFVLARFVYKRLRATKSA